MTLLVHTARVSTRDPDRFDVTRKSGGPKGEPFAPSWAILRPALAALAEARQLADLAAAASEEATGGRLSAEDRSQGRRVVSEPVWIDYAAKYLAEMRVSYRLNSEAWRALLARERIVLVCYCTDPEHCHRTLLAGILGKLGADVRGELSEAPPAQLTLGGAP